MQNVVIDDDGTTTEHDAAEWFALPDLSGHVLTTDVQWLFEEMAPGGVKDSNVRGLAGPEAAAKPTDEGLADDGFWEISEATDGSWELPCTGRAGEKPQHPLAVEGISCVMASRPTEFDGDADRRRDEAEAMAAMYPLNFVKVSEREWLFRYDLACGVVGEMGMKLPRNYPSGSPPKLTLDVPGIRDLKEVRAILLSKYSPDLEVGFAWAEYFEEVCRGLAEQLEILGKERRAERAKRLGLALPAQEADLAENKPTGAIAQPFSRREKMLLSMPSWSMQHEVYKCGYWQHEVDKYSYWRQRETEYTQKRREEAEAKRKRAEQRKQEEKRIAAWKAKGLTPCEHHRQCA